MVVQSLWRVLSLTLWKCPAFGTCYSYNSVNQICAIPGLKKVCVCVKKKKIRIYDIYIYIYKFYMYIYILLLFFFVCFVFQRWLLKSKICNWLDQTNTASQDGISAIYLHQPTNQLHTLVSNSFGIRLIEQKAWVLDRRPCQWTCESYGQMEQTEIRTFGWFRKKEKGKKNPHREWCALIHQLMGSLFSLHHS